jgi:calcineurin-like phosphoesterase family protein
MHYGHQNILKYCDRPFDDLDHMHGELIKRWNSVVTDQDIVYIVGDAVMGQRETTLQFIKQLAGHKYLVPGNHDDCHAMYAGKQKYARMQEMYFEVFDDILDEQYIVDEFLLCHFPYNRPGLTDYAGRDYSQWEPVDHGATLLCGHIHEEWDHQFTPQGTLQLNVGVDVRNFTPISIDGIRDLTRLLTGTPEQESSHA